MDLQNKQADQLEQLTSMVTNNLNMLDNLQDPIEKMMDKSKKFGNRIRTNDKVKFFKDSQKLMNKVLHGSSTKKGSVEGSISVDGDLEGLNDSINKTTKNTNEFFDNLLNVRIGEELPYMMNEFNDSHLERISELDEEYESMFNRQADLHDFERDVEDSFEDIKDTTGDFFNFFDEKMGAIGLDSASILGAAGIGGGVINIGGAIKEGVDKNLEVMEKFRRMTGSTKEEWKDFKNLLYEDTSEINERFENYQFGSTQRMDAVDDVLNTGITDPNKIRQVSDSVMMMNALSENVDLSGFEFLQTQLYQLSSEDASGLTEYLTEFAASVADLKGVDPEDVFESFDEYGKSIKAVTSNNREFRRHIENLTEFGLALQTTGMAEGTMEDLQGTLSGVLESGGALSDQAMQIAKVTQMSRGVAGLNPQQISQMLQEGRYDEVGTDYVNAIRDTFDPNTMSVEQMFTKANAMGLDYGMVQDIIAEDYDIEQALRDVRGSRDESTAAAGESGSTITQDYFNKSVQQPMIDLVNNTASLSKPALWASNFAEEFGVSGGFTGLIGSAFDLLKDTGLGELLGTGAVGVGSWFLGSKAAGAGGLLSWLKGLFSSGGAGAGGASGGTGGAAAGAGLWASLKTNVLPAVSQGMNLVNPASWSVLINEGLRHFPEVDEFLFGDYSWENIEERNKENTEETKNLNESIQELNETLSNGDSGSTTDYNRQMEGLLEHEGLSDLMGAIYQSEGGSNASVPYGLTGFRAQGNQFTSNSRSGKFENLLNETGYKEGSKGYWSAAAAATISQYVDNYINKFVPSASGYGDLSEGHKRNFINWFSSQWAPTSGNISAAEAKLNPNLPNNIMRNLGLQEGGLIPGYGGGDIVPAMLEPGELVIPKEVVRAGFKTAERATNMAKRSAGNMVNVIVNNDDVVEVIKWATYKIEKAIKNTADKDNQERERPRRRAKMTPGLEKQINLN
jgi:hypothetical protein